MCMKPIIINSRLVPCGKCDECINKKWKHLFSRINGEFCTSYVTLMLTLTYDDAHLKDGHDCKRDIALFFKRFRYVYPKIKFKYFWCIEKGKEHGRVHYHVLMFFSQECFYRVFDFNYCWENGFVKVARVRNARSCGYTLKYIYKDAFKGYFPKGTRRFGSSANLGVEYFWRNADFMKALEFGCLSRSCYNVDPKIVACILKRKAKMQSVSFFRNYIDSMVDHNIYFEYSCSKPVASKNLADVVKFYAYNILFKKIFCCDFCKYFKSEKVEDELLDFYIHKCEDTSFYSMHNVKYDHFLPVCYYGNEIQPNFDFKIDFEYLVYL